MNAGSAQAGGLAGIIEGISRRFRSGSAPISARPFIPRKWVAIKKKHRVTFEKSSGNVFADIGFANPEREQLKAHLTLQIYRIIKDRGLTQAQAGTILGIKQPHVSALMRNRSGNFSVERLMDFLVALGQDVEITVRPTRKHHGQVSVVLP